MENFVGSGILVTQANVSLQKSGLAGHLLNIKDQYECLGKLIQKMECAKYTIKEAVQAIHKLDFGEDTCNIKHYIKQKNAKQWLCITCFKIFNPNLFL